MFKLDKAKCEPNKFSNTNLIEACVNNLIGDCFEIVCDDQSWSDEITEILISHDIPDSVARQD